MILVALLLVAVVSAATGAYGGRWLVRRALEPIPDGLDVMAASAKRANTASAVIESISADSPALLERLEDVDNRVRRFTLTAQGASATADDAAGRVGALEHAIASHFGLSVALSSKGD